ncbi:YbjN domain-containing protein [Candidatus Fukatsuia symbiotica]|uniref:YbjN domain-containing protein n=1 Tax=Candidatus Fukatsuia symbiotica TaxID=1878942 RepID=A0A2U8I3R9_9GAMM|nr:YbjN domain-containing protein [Candidatus Fukatsuia symbiotica]AWK13782.1 YbjN domain-containing protein [Candidatus Fukatsuia symbiotica]MEA9445968.1 YbjN domain-containing protein [Candidatus Fukatsuia symbiotica]
MSSLNALDFKVPDLALLRCWLSQLGCPFFECDSCQALHLCHMQKCDGVSDARIDLKDDVILFSVLAEIRPTALIPLSSNLSQINTLSLTAKAFINIEENDNLAQLIVCQSISIATGITEQQFDHFMQQSTEQISMIISTVAENDMLFLSDDYEYEDDEEEEEEEEEKNSPPVSRFRPIIH